MLLQHKRKNAFPEIGLAPKRLHCENDQVFKRSKDQKRWTDIRSIVVQSAISRSTGDRVAWRRIGLDTGTVTQPSTVL